MNGNQKQHYTLERPLTPKQGEAITEVVIVEPNGADMEILDQFMTVSASGETVLSRPIGYTLTMIDRLCRYPNGDPLFDGFARMLKAVDVDALGELVMAMLPDGQGTGRTV